MKTLIATLSLLGILVTSTAFAQRGDEGVTVYGENTWTDDLVIGDLLRPDGDLMLSRGRASKISLIRVRTNFVPEMLKSVERQ